MYGRSNITDGKNGCVRNSLGIFMIVTQDIFIYSYVWPYKKKDKMIGIFTKYSNNNYFKQENGASVTPVENQSP